MHRISTFSKLDSDEVRKLILCMSDDIFDCGKAQVWIGGSLSMNGFQSAGMQLLNMKEEEFAHYILNLLG